MKQVKRISSLNKSGPFVGSEFAFEDFTALELQEFSYRYLGEEPCGERVCDVVERIPRYEHSGYSRQKAWIDRDVHQVRKVEFYDRKDALLKTLMLTDYRQYKGGWWRSHRLSMVNHVTGKSTDLLYGDYAFGLGLDKDDFSRGGAAASAVNAIPPQIVPAPRPLLRVRLTAPGRRRVRRGRVDHLGLHRPGAAVVPGFARLPRPARRHPALRTFRARAALAQRGPPAPGRSGGVRSLGRRGRRAHPFGLARRLLPIRRRLFRASGRREPAVLGGSPNRVTWWT